MGGSAALGAPPHFLLKETKKQRQKTNKQKKQQQKTKKPRNLRRCRVMVPASAGPYPTALPQTGMTTTGRCT